MFDYDASQKTLDAFAKWLFGTSTVVGSLAAGLSVVGLAAYTPVATIMVASAVACLGVALSLAALSLQPRWKITNPNSIAKLVDVVQEQLEYRSRRLSVAARFFAVALLLAAVSPLAAHLSRPRATGRLAIAYQRTAGNTFKLECSGQGLDPFAPVTLVGRMSGVAAGNIARSHGVANSGGKLDPLALEVPSAPGAAIVAVCRCRDGEGSAIADSVVLTAPPRLGMVNVLYEVAGDRVKARCRGHGLAPGALITLSSRAKPRRGGATVTPFVREAADANGDIEGAEVELRATADDVLSIVCACAQGVNAGLVDSVEIAIGGPRRGALGRPR
jgi:hypothetical protein